VHPLLVVCGGTWTTYKTYTLNSTTISTPQTTNNGCTIWYKIANGSEPAQFSIPMTDDGVDAVSLVCMAFRNATTLVSVNAAAGDQGPTLSFVQAGDCMVSMHGTANDTTSAGSSHQSVPYGMHLGKGNYSRFGSGDTGEVGMLTAYKLGLPAGSTGINSWRTYGSALWNTYAIAVNILIR